MRRPSPSFAVAALLAIAVLVPSDASAQPADGEAKSLLIVPFGVDGIGTVKLAAALTAAVGSLLEGDAAVSAQVAQAPRVDILTLIECPSGGDDCIGGLAQTLAVDRAITAEVRERATGLFVASVVIARGDGTFERFAVELEGATLDARVHAFQRAIAPRLGVAPPAPRAEDVPVKALLPGPADASAAPTAPDTTPRPMTEPGPESGERRYGLRKVRPVSWISTGAGVAGLTMGFLFYAASKSTEREIENAPTLTSADIAELRDLEDRGDRERTTAAIMLLGGTALTAVGITLVYLDISRDDGDSAVGVVPTSGGAMATWGGRF